MTALPVPVNSLALGKDGKRSGAPGFRRAARADWLWGCV